MKKCIRNATLNTVLAVAAKRSAGLDVTSVGGIMALLVLKACSSARSHTREKDKEVFNLQSSKSLILLSCITHFCVPAELQALRLHHSGNYGIIPIRFGALLQSLTQEGPSVSRKKLSV